MKSPIFDKIRVSALENITPPKIQNNDFSQYFNYKTFEAIGISEDELALLLKDQLSKEIRKVRKAQAAKKN